MSSTRRPAVHRAVAILCAVLLPFSIGFAQLPAAPPQASPNGQPTPLLTPDQLDTLVAPVALYPDPLLSQVLAASTYPLEVVEAQQWVDHNPNLRGEQLMNAAKQQNWDPSVQALVAFPEALRLMNNDVRWTTDLGNSFLAQQNDLMNAVQTMRARASANGRLATTPQQVVTTDSQNGQSAIEIQPANPQVMYVPEYSPSYVWGAPAWDPYFDLWYPGFGFGFGFGPGIYLGGFFPGWGGWGGWGWGFGWFGGGLFVNTGFFGHYGFRGGYGGFRGAAGGRAAWAHDPGHRMGVPYPNRAVASRFNSTRFNGSTSARTSGGWSRVGQSGAAQANRSASSSNGWRSVGSGSQATSRYSSGSSANRAAPNARGAGAAPAYRGGSSYAAPRSSAPQSYSAPRQNYSAPRQNYSAPRQSYSAPRSSGGGSSSSGGRSSGGGGGRRR